MKAVRFASAARNVDRQNSSSIGVGLPTWMTRNRIGDSGSWRASATNLRSVSKITARSPASASWLTDVTDSSNTHGWRART